LLDLTGINSTLQSIIASIELNLPIMASLVGFTFFIQILNVALGYRLCAFGIHPRHLLGLVGIPLSPFIHGSFNHFFSNAMVFFAMANLIVLEGQQQFILITAIITVLGGLATWLVGRSEVHVGASGIIMGYWGYLLVNAYHHPTLMTIMMGILCLYFFGGLLSSMIPDDAKESWESHVFGVVAGVASSYLYPYIVPYVSHDLDAFSRTLNQVSF